LTTIPELRLAANKAKTAYTLKIQHQGLKIKVKINFIDNHAFKGKQGKEKEAFII
jgi:hypothetical protein